MGEEQADACLEILESVISEARSAVKRWAGVDHLSISSFFETMTPIGNPAAMGLAEKMASGSTPQYSMANIFPVARAQVKVILGIRINAVILANNYIFL